MRYFDTIIVGQGLAGTALAWQMEFAGRQSYLILDREPLVTSSRIAAGLITPITGQRLVKAERFEEYFGIAEAFYRRVEAELGAVVFHRRPALRLFQNEREQEIFAAKRDTEFAGLVAANLEINSEVIATPLGGFTMTTAGQLDAQPYLNQSRNWFAHRNSYRAAELDVDNDLVLADDGVRIPKLDLWANRVIFCQGFLNEPNPYFTDVPFQAAQGDILTLRIPAFRETRVIHAHGIWLAPADVCDLYRCGSTYSWEPFDGQPSEAGRAELERKIKEFLKLPYEVVDHRAAVRPIIRESRPRLGMHPKHPRLGFFNGLGSKGSLLAPHFAGMFVRHLFEGKTLNAEVDVRGVL